MLLSHGLVLILALTFAAWQSGLIPSPALNPRTLLTQLLSWMHICNRSLLWDRAIPYLLYFQCLANSVSIPGPLAQLWLTLSDYVTKKGFRKMSTTMVSLSEDPTWWFSFWHSWLGTYSLVSVCGDFNLITATYYIYGLGRVNWLLCLSFLICQMRIIMELFSRAMFIWGLAWCLHPSLRVIIWDDCRKL